MKAETTSLAAGGVLPGRTLPQHFYTDKALFDAEMERVWGRGWLFAGLSAELPAPGDILTWSPGRESLLLIRGDDRVIRAFHNVCRHRGCRLLTDGAVNLRRVVCPYHQWTYGRDGALRSAWGTGGEVAADELSLVQLPVRDISGLLFASFAPQPPSLAAAEHAIAPQLAPHQVDATQVAHRASYSVAANWKVLVENNRECYHCRGNHPEFCVSNYELGSAGDVRTSEEYERETRRQEALWAAAGLSPRVVNFPDGDFFRIARLPLRPGFATESMSGRRVAPRLGTLTTDHTGSVRLIFLPNTWAHVNCDYVMTTRLRPVSVDQTDVDVCFLVRAGAREGQDYDLGELTRVWTATSEQDWALCEANYAGIRSRGYRPGPLSTLTEGAIEQFYHWYLGRLLSA
jgi:glycine betaine catabolism A